ncbi:MAG: ferritin-like protein [Solirubrobacteraceae bacterium]|nr:ferritin-like protein [Solirubrobacteraceae bacterium]
MNNENLAVPELATVEITGLTRSAFILRGAMAAGAVYGLGAVSPFVGQALAQGGGDADIVNFALTLEYLESAFYTEAVKKVPGLSGTTLALAKEIRDNEAEHVSALTAAVKQLGGTPVKAPGVTFGGAFASKDAFLKTANVFEDTGVSAYNGAAPGIKSTAILAAAGSIVQVEARHASLIRLARGAAPAPLAFDKASPKAAVLAAVKPFIKA